MRLFVLAALLLVVSLPSQATEKSHREHGAHQHGHGSLNMAIDGNRVDIELIAPGADIVGFERKPESPAEKTAVEAAQKTLSEIGNVIVFPAAAGCKTAKVDVEIHAEKDEPHTEFHVSYQLTCTSPQNITDVTLSYFQNHPRAEELEVNVIGPKGSQVFEIDRKQPKLDLGGVI
jgi:hypothetical protein